MSEVEKRISFKLWDFFRREHRDNLKRMIGKLLTLIDGTTTEETQRKALKDITEGIVYDYSNIEQRMFNYYIEYLAIALKEDSRWLGKKDEDGKDEDSRENPLVIG